MIHNTDMHSVTEVELTKCAALDFWQDKTIGVQPRTQPRVNATAVYSDFEGEQTVYSINQAYQWSQSESDTQLSQTITTQGLQDLARAKRMQQMEKRK